MGVEGSPWPEFTGPLGLNLFPEEPGRLCAGDLWIDGSQAVSANPKEGARRARSGGTRSHARARALRAVGKKLPGGGRAYDNLHGCGCDSLLLFKFVTHARTIIVTSCGMIPFDVTIW